ncbi:hypothetical protein BDB00DRAFT_786196 [Zychaea mexicana]|uniref:uncharacterized protein n=1 Tax=Zychaea mexicana TaxID=64656 RepID=UPI0022FF358C|nr:uncharacterized protein BDB00DRAFT_786196 [Zychaea mexicana]KAI9495677.1 hypothetical protein BDB00DRAFT_786196 [Zychaea mexicana]
MPPSPPPNRNTHQNRHIVVERRSAAPMRTCEPCRRRKRPCNGVRPCVHCSESHIECVYSVVSDLPRTVFTTSSARRLSSGSACETCRRRKTKCDGGSPCGFCASAGIECVNNSERRKRAMGIPSSANGSPVNTTTTTTTTTHGVNGTLVAGSHHNNNNNPPDAEAIDRIEDRLRRIEELMTAFTPATHSPLSHGSSSSSSNSGGGHSSTRMIRQHRHSVQGISVAKEQAELRTAYALKKKQRMSPPPASLAFDTFTTTTATAMNTILTSTTSSTTTSASPYTTTTTTTTTKTAPTPPHSSSSSTSSSAAVAAAAAAIARNGSNKRYSPPRHASPSPPPPLSPTLMIRQSSTTTNPLTSSMLNLTLSPSSSSTSSTSNNSSMLMAAPQSSMSTPAAANNIVSPTTPTSNHGHQDHHQLLPPPSSSSASTCNPPPPPPPPSHWSTADTMTEWKIASSSMPSLMDQLSKRTFATSSAFNTTEYPPYPLSLTPPQSSSSPSPAIE